MKLMNMKQYKPEVMPYGDDVIHYQSENGKDFYKFLKYFKKKYKLLIDSNSVIVSCCEDINGLSIEGLSIVETDTLPDGFNILGGWMFNKKSEIVPYAPWYQLKAEGERTTRINAAMSDVTLLTGKVFLSIASDDEKQLFAALSDHISQLKTMDFSGVSDAQTRSAIVWPEKPQ